MAQIAGWYGETERQIQLNARAHQLAETIRTRFWSSGEGLFGDVISGAEEMAVRLRRWSAEARAEGRDDVADAFDKAVLNDPGEHLFNLRNWVINTPLETGIATEEQASRALSRMRQADFSGAHGLYLSGLWRTHMMTISTGVQAVAEARYHNPDHALDWMRRTAATMDWRMPGSMSEMSPDYGCFVQAWTVYGLAVPLVEHFFGIKPRAHEGRATIACNMPKRWPWAELTGVRLGQNVIDLRYSREGDLAELTISTRLAWRFDLEMPLAAIKTSSGGQRIGESGVSLPKGGWLTVQWQAV
jgi:hypothetical protein